MHSEHWVEQMRQTDTMRLGNQAKQVPFAVEAPGATVFYDFKAPLVVTIEQLVGNTASWRLVGQLQRLGAKPLDADHRDNLIRQNAPDCGGWQEVFEAGHIFPGGYARFI